MTTAAKTMTRSQKRVAVASDVLAQLNAKKLHIAHGSYIQTIFGAHVEDIVGEAEDIQRVADSLTDNCRVCLLGACLLSKARLFNKAEAKWLVKSDCSITAAVEEIPKALGDVFTRLQIAMIEAAFEGNTIAIDGPWTEQEQKRLDDAGKFHLAHHGGVLDDTIDLEGVVRAVMKNIIRNRGDFHPDQDLPDEE